MKLFTLFTPLFAFLWKKKVLTIIGIALWARRTKSYDGRGGGNRPVVGEITSSDEKSLTVKMVDGSSKIVILSNSTGINKQATGTKSDLKTGEQVLIMGTTNSDGSVTATNIQLNPTGRGMMGEQSATKSGQ